MATCFHDGLGGRDFRFSNLFLHWPITENNKSYLVFFTNIDETIVLSKKNPFRISINDKTQEPSPYIMVRKNIEAKIDRKSFYRLLDLAEYSLVKGQEWLGIHSDSTFFPIISKEKLHN